MMQMFLDNTDLVSRSQGQKQTASFMCCLIILVQCILGWHMVVAYIEQVRHSMLCEWCV